MEFDVRSARPPTRPLAFVRWLWRLILDIADEYANDGVGDLAAAITFWTLVSIPAAALALVSTLSSLESIVGADLADEARTAIVDIVNDTFVNSATVTDTVNDLFVNSSTGVATAATLVAFFTLSRAFAGMIRAFDRAYNIEDGRPWWYLRIVAIGLGLGTLVVLAATIAVFALLFGFDVSGVWRVVTGVGVFIGVTAWVNVMFHLSPNHRTPVLHDLPGALLTSLGWALAIQLFSLYLRFARGSNQVQSSVGAILLAVTLLYAMAVVLMVGAELNSVLAQRTRVAVANRHVNDKIRSVRDRVRSSRSAPRDAPEPADEPIREPVTPSGDDP